MKINGYDVAIERIAAGTAKGQWRATINGKTVAVSPRKQAAMNNADFIASRISPEAFRALVNPIAEAAA